MLTNEIEKIGQNISTHPSAELITIDLCDIEERMKNAQRPRRTLQGLIEARHLYYGYFMNDLEYTFVVWFGISVRVFNYSNINYDTVVAMVIMQNT